MHALLPTQQQSLERYTVQRCGWPRDPLGLHSHFALEVLGAERARFVACGAGPRCCWRFLGVCVRVYRRECHRVGRRNRHAFERAGDPQMVNK